MQTLNIKAEYVKYASQFMPKNDVRFNLMGIHVRPHPSHGVFIEATNGHILGVFYDETGTCSAPTTIKPSKDLLKACIKPKLKHSLGLSLILANDQLKVCHDFKDGTFIETFIQPTDCTIDATFPDVTKVIQTAGLKAGAPGAYDSAYLPLFSFGARKGEFNGFLSNGDPNCSVVVLNTAFPEFIGVIMPVRTEAFVIPEWLTAPICIAA